NGGHYPPMETPVTFTRVGTFNGTTIYRADLTHIAPGIRSIILTDSNSKGRGSKGKFSGFELDANALSRDFIDSVTNTPANFPDLNDPNVLRQLDVFDFSAAGMTLTPGTQRDGADGGVTNPPQPDLNGVTNGIIYNATLNVFDAT